MLSVEPTLERTWRRSGPAALAGRGARAAGPALPLLPAALPAALLASADTVEAVAALGAAALGLGRLGAVPGTLEAAVEGVVALLLVVLPGALLGRLESAVGRRGGKGRSGSGTERPRTHRTA